MILLTLKLLLAHLLGDFVFQSSKWIRDKQQMIHRSRYLYLHLGVHLILLVILLGNPTRYWLGILIIVISHFVIDLAKLSFRTKMNDRLLFFSDQLVHLLIILVVVTLYESYSFQLEILSEPKVYLLAIAVVFTTRDSSIVMKLLLAKWTASDDFSRDSLSQAGEYIGMLERLFIFFFVVLNYWQSIGFLLAAKSVFRFGDLSKAKDRKLTEYMLIGTLLSFALAILSGLSYSYLVGKI